VVSRESTGRVSDRVAGLLAPVVGAGGFDLEDVSVTRAGTRSVVRVVVDRDGGVDLDGIAEASRLVSATLDDSEPLPGAYVLEVTSPGVDRPLTAPRHWRRARGRLVSVSGPGLRLTGRVGDSDETGVELQVGEDVRRVEFDQLSRAVVQVEFSHHTGPEDPHEEEGP
jgi:ribosome maturation factor RimP